MAKQTESEKQLIIAYEDSEFSAMEILVDLDLRTGTPVEETGWLSGNAGGSYPGTLTGFTAQNTDGNAVGSLRLVTIQFTLATTDAEVFVFTGGCSKILGVVGSSFEVADKTLSIAFTNTGADGAPPAKTGGSLGAIEAHAEGAGAGTITLLLLN
tara:strand:+ start:20099 stop:20563 length:465 start_codon:yes stop_codon:yes gene_type:complete